MTRVEAWLLERMSVRRWLVTIAIVALGVGAAAWAAGHQAGRATEVAAEQARWRTVEDRLSMSTDPTSRVAAASLQRARLIAEKVRAEGR
jgi:hypothetical protein